VAGHDFCRLLPEVRKLFLSRSVQAFGRHLVTPLNGSALDASRRLQLGAFSPGYYFVQFWYFPLTAGEEFLATRKQILDLLAQIVYKRNCKKGGVMVLLRKT
jgi:hypothetical protein